MPWSCGTCGIDVHDGHAACPVCAAKKTHWTMVREATRKFVLAAKKFEVLRGEALAPAERAPVLARAAAGAPGPDQVLRVRLHPKSHKDLTVTLTVNPAHGEAVEHALPFQGAPAPREDGSLDVFVLLVRGPGADPVLPGLHVVEAGEGDGAAPTIEVQALGRPRKELPTELVAAEGLELTVHAIEDPEDGDGAADAGSPAELDDLVLSVVAVDAGEP